MSSSRGNIIRIPKIKPKLIKISAINLAKQYADTLRNAANDPVDVGDSIEMMLPDFAEHERIRR